MEDFDFRASSAAYGAAARRCREPDFDGCEVIAVAHHLIDSFLSPAVNQRTTMKYGGAGRTAPVSDLEVLPGGAQSGGPDYIVGLRLSGDELLEGGLAADDCVQLAMLYGKRWPGRLSQCLPGPWRHLPRHRDDAAERILSAGAVSSRRARSRRRGGPACVSRLGIRDIATANRAIAEGHVDMVAMTRGHIADPYIVKKLMEDRPDSIRQCVRRLLH